MNQSDWNWILVLGICTLVIFTFFIFSTKHKLDNTLLGFFTIGVALICIAILKPDNIKFQGVELTKRVDKIERELRPYAAIDVPLNKQSASKGILYQTFKDGEFKWPKQSPTPNEYKFILAKNAEYVEIRCDMAVASIDRKISHGNETEYTFRLVSSIINGDNVRCIIESFLKKDN